MAAGKLQASTFTYPPPSREAKILHESRNTPHSSKVSGYGRRGLRSTRLLVHPAPSP